MPNRCAEACWEAAKKDMKLSFDFEGIEVSPFVSYHNVDVSEVGRCRLQTHNNIKWNVYSTSYLICWQGAGPHRRSV